MSKDTPLTFDEHTLLKAAVKYGRAIAHVATMYHHLMHATGGQNCELEVSVDETRIADLTRRTHLQSPANCGDWASNG